MLSELLEKHDPDFERREALAEARASAKAGVEGSPDLNAQSTASVVTPQGERITVVADKGSTRVIEVLPPQS